mmetsp:Transcript_5652/g.17818  ORF Transcript_5652/g.17818 Transcript_5652/m.17818 type:complete len:202 (+) Transcript_5652:1246-1851(+)
MRQSVGDGRRHRRATAARGDAEAGHVHPGLAVQVIVSGIQALLQHPGGDPLVCGSAEVLDQHAILDGLDLVDANLLFHVKVISVLVRPVTDSRCGDPAVGAALVEAAIPGPQPQRPERGGRGPGPQLRAGGRHLWADLRRHGARGQANAGDVHALLAVQVNGPVDPVGSQDAGRDPLVHGRAVVLHGGAGRVVHRGGVSAR